MASDPVLPARPRTAQPALRWSLAIAVATMAGAGLFELCDVSVFRRIGLAHEYCYLREPRLIWLHVVSDTLIGTAYVSISATLSYLVYRASRAIPFNWVLLAFGLFIVSCGLTHFMEVWVIWQPMYWLSGYVKVLTAAASVATAVALFPLVPRIFRLIESARSGERRRVEIEQLNDELERFNYTVAHDLRAPLRGIIGFGHALRQDCAESLTPEGRSYIEKMQYSAAQMDALICDLLKYATVGRQQLERRPCELEPMVRSVLTLLETEIQAADAAVVITPLPAVIGDPTLLQVVFQNLISNAVKFVAPGVRPEVEIVGEIQAGRARISVTDNGVGIPPDSRERVFRMFERLHGGYEGTGIGLAIVHRAVERLEGRVAFESAPQGAGTRFWIELPLAAQEHTAGES
jgi:signal transduction histidine kinase